MIYTPTTKKAMKLMFEKHKDQVDKSGMPYVFHPMHVAESMEDENTTVVALLHDIVEDTDMTLDDLRQLGFNEECLTALNLMTHDESVDYFDYVVSIGENDIARKVKMSDLKHNSDLTRLSNVTEKDLMRVEKYKRCLNYLQEIDEKKKQDKTSEEITLK